MSYRVYFKDVGGGKKTWETTLECLSYDNLKKAVKKVGAIGSRFPDFNLDEETQTGAIFCGFRCCGTFTWVTSIDPKP